MAGFEEATDNAYLQADKVVVAPKVGVFVYRTAKFVGCDGYNYQQQQPPQQQQQYQPPQQIYLQQPLPPPPTNPYRPNDGFIH
jgi:hypothetical protein